MQQAKAMRAIPACHEGFDAQGLFPRNVSVHGSWLATGHLLTFPMPRALHQGKSSTAITQNLDEDMGPSIT